MEIYCPPPRLRTSSLYTADEPGVVRCDFLFILLRRVILRFARLDTVNSGHNETNKALRLATPDSS